MPPAPDGYAPRPSSVLEPEWRTPQLMAPPAWMKWGGRGLSVAGAGVGYWSAYSEEYNEDLLDHPEWSEGERRGSAVTSSAVVGTAAVVGAAPRQDERGGDADRGRAPRSTPGESHRSPSRWLFSADRPAWLRWQADV